MTRRALLFTIIAVFTALVLTGGTRAHAQAPGCCTFDISASFAHPPACFPFSVTTNWGPGAGANQTDLHGAPGIVTYAITAVACPPAPAFNWASLDGGITKIPFNVPTVVIVPGCGCVTVRTGLSTPGGCIQIHIATC